MHQLKPLLRPAYGNRLHHAPAPARPVARGGIDVPGPQAQGAVIAVAPVGQGLDPAAAVRADKARILIASTHVLVSLRWG